jgi:DNA-directed RNA polymerase specialized sigma54-like protein
MDEGDPRKGTLMDVSKVIVEHQSGLLRRSSHIELQPQEDLLHSMLLLHL